jgi:hypothetical protein
MARFDRQIATALRLIQKNGQQVAWRQSQSQPDPAEPFKVIPAERSEHSPFVCFLPVNKENREVFALLRGTANVVTGAELGLMGAVDFAPSVKDKVIRDGKALDIKSIDVLRPNGRPILYTIEFST